MSDDNVDSLFGDDGGGGGGGGQRDRGDRGGRGGRGDLADAAMAAAGAAAEGGKGKACGCQTKASPAAMAAKVGAVLLVGAVVGRMVWR